jgi:hypothetical protein
MNTCRRSLYPTDNEVGYSKQRKRLPTLRNEATSNSHQNHQMYVHDENTLNARSRYQQKRLGIADTLPMPLAPELGASPPLQHFR